MAITSEKGSDAIQHVEAASSTASPECDALTTGETIDDQIVHQLESGEVIGFTWRTACACIALILCYNSYVFCLQIPPNMLSSINAELGPDPRFTWISISWNLGGAIVVTISGRLSDIFGRRYFFLIGACLLVVGSIVAVTGHSISQMIASGVIYGVGSGSLEMAYGAIQEIVPNNWRMVAVGALDVSGGLIAGSAPIVAWALFDRTGTWRTAYYYMLAFHIVTVIFVFFFYHPPKFETKHKHDGKTKMELVKKLDFIGLALFVIGCCLFLVGLSWGGSIHPWKSAATIAPIVLGASTLIGLGVYENYAQLDYPILPPRLFKRVRNFTVPLIVIAVSAMQYYSNAVLWPRMSQLLWAQTPIMKGFYGQAIPIGTVIGGIFILFSAKLGHQRWQIVFFILLQTACVGAMSTSTLETPARSYVLVCIISICTAPSQLITIVMIMFGLEDQNDIGIASGIAGTTRLIFGAMATAIFSNILNNEYTKILPSYVSSAALPLGYPAANMTKLAGAAKVGSAAAFKAVPGITPAIQAAAVKANKLAYLKGSQLVFYVAVAFGVIACVASLFTVSIDRRKYTKNTMAVLETEQRVVSDKEKEVGGTA